jgi:hypothetical protein
MATCYWDLQCVSHVPGMQIKWLRETTKRVIILINVTISILNVDNMKRNLLTLKSRVVNICTTCFNRQLCVLYLWVLYDSQCKYRLYA